LSDEKSFAGRAAIVTGATRGIGWSPHLWLGVVVFAGIIGWLLSYLLLPPRVAPDVRS